MTLLLKIRTEKVSLAFLRKLLNFIKNNYNDTSNKMEDKLDKSDIEQKNNDSVMNLELKTHNHLIEAISPVYKMFLVDLCNKTAEEYGCQNPSEIMLVEMFVNAYIRSIESTKVFNDNLHDGLLTGLYKNKELLKLYDLMIKEMDKANRIFLATLFNLRLLKSANPKIDIKIKNTFMAKEQQVILNDENR